MKTIYQKIDRLKPDPQIIETAATMIRQGGLVAFPTETVYGLGANGLDPLAVERIFLAKGRPADNPLILHIAERQELSGLVSEIPDWLKPVLGIEMSEGKTGSFVRFRVERLHRVLQATDLSNQRNTPIAHRDQLADTARFLV